MTDEQASKILAKSLGFLLRDREGISIVLDGCMYSVYKFEDEIFIGELSKNEKCMVTGEGLKDGELLWMQASPIQ